MSEQKKEPFWIRCGDTTPRDRRNVTRLAWTMVVWAVTTLGIARVIEHQLITEGPMLWLLAILPTIAGIFLVLAYARYLREADEMQRAIQLNAFAMAFGGAWLMVSSYKIFEKMGAPEADKSDVVFVMAICYALGCLVGWRRYQ